MATIIRRAKNAVLSTLDGRHFNFGPPTAQYTHTVMATTYVDWHQLAADVRWDTSCGADVTIIAKLGPLGVQVTVARRRERPDSEDPSTLHTRRLGRYDLFTWHTWRHVGVCIDGLPGRLWRVEVGPFGVAAERVR